MKRYEDGFNMPQDKQFFPYTSTRATSESYKKLFYKSKAFIKMMSS